MLLTGLGIISLVHRNVHDMAVELVAHAHLNPASHYPNIFLDAASQLTDSKLWLYAFAAASYASLRLVEAYGLWYAKAWAEWLAALSGALYVPIELFELYHSATWLGLALLLVNLFVVAIMLQAVRSRAKSRTHNAV